MKKSLKRLSLAKETLRRISAGIAVGEGPGINPEGPVKTQRTWVCDTGLADCGATYPGTCVCA